MINQGKIEKAHNSKKASGHILFRTLNVSFRLWDCHSQKELAFW